MVPLAVGKKDGVLQADIDVIDEVMNAVIEDGKAVAYDDSTAANSKSGTPALENQVLCAPISTGDKPASGVIFINRAPQLEEDLPEQLDYLNAAAVLVATAFTHARLDDKTKDASRLKQMLERFHAPNIVEKRAAELIREGSNQQLTQMEQRSVAVLFADLAGFTALTEKLSPERVVELLNEFYDQATRVIFSFEGTVDKFMGDSVMTIFGTALPTERYHPRSASRPGSSSRMGTRHEPPARQGTLQAPGRPGLRQGAGGDSRLERTDGLHGGGRSRECRLVAVCFRGPGSDSGHQRGDPPRRCAFRLRDAGPAPLPRDKKKVAVFEMTDEDRNRETTL